MGAVYIELHASSAFSFLDGASLPEALVERAAALGYPALALLDRDGVYGAPRFHLAAKRAGIKAIIGAELTVSSGLARPFEHPPSRFALRRASRELAFDSAAPRSGQANLRHREHASRDPANVFAPRPHRIARRLPQSLPAGDDDEAAGAEGGGGADARRARRPRRAGSSRSSAAPRSTAARFGVGGLVDRLVGVFGASQVYVELQRHLLRDEESDNQVLRDLAAAFHVPVIATNGVRFAEPVDRPLYDVLTCIRHKTTLAHAGRRLTCNAERYLKPPERWRGCSPTCRRRSPPPASSPIASATRWRISATAFPNTRCRRARRWRRSCARSTQAGARERYRPYDDRARRQIERELDLIEKLDLAGYFLIVWDIVNYCRQHDILVQGRGSAANSAVCYSLGITAVDPIGMDLLFERFLSEERGEWPDIDLDLPSGDRRERVIQHMYEKYGTHGSAAPRIAMTANVITYRGRSAAREVGKVLSLEPGRSTGWPR